MRERVDFLLMPCLPSFTQDVLAKSLPFLTDESLIADDISYEGLLATCQGRESYLSAMRDWQQLVPERLEDFKVLSLESWRLNPGVVTARCGARVLKKNGRGGAAFSLTRFQKHRAWLGKKLNCLFQGGALPSSRRFRLRGSFASCHRMRRCSLGQRPLAVTLVFFGVAL